jgi:hypothetical protein
VETARDVIALAEGGFPASRWVQTQKAEVAKALATEPVGQAPVAAAAGGPEGRLKLERFFFERVDELLRDRKWSQAENLIREARGMRPPLAWVEPRDGDIRLAEVRLNQGRGEVPMMLASARLYLNGDVERSRRMTALAREMVEAGDKLGAIALVEAVLQRTPEVGGAQRLRAELKPQPQAAKYSHRPLNSGLFGRRERQRVAGSLLAGARGYPAKQSPNFLGDEMNWRGGGGRGAD